MDSTYNIIQSVDNRHGLLYLLGEQLIINELIDASFIYLEKYLNLCIKTYFKDLKSIELELAFYENRQKKAHLKYERQLQKEKDSDERMRRFIESQRGSEYEPD